MLDGHLKNIPMIQANKQSKTISHYKCIYTLSFPNIIIIIIMILEILAIVHHHLSFWLQYFLI